VLRNRAAATLQKYWRRQLAMRELASLRLQAAAAAAQREEEARQAAATVLQVGEGKQPSQVAFISKVAFAADMPDGQE
jgi:hypothetical protein